MMNSSNGFPTLRRVSALMSLGLTLTCTSLPGALVLATAGTARAQRGPTQRIVEGKVALKDGSPLKGAVVYLKDEKSQSVRSAISGEDGSYRFVQLAQSTDYEVWAQSDAKRSKSRNISSFDSKPSYNFTLTIDK